MGRWGNERGVTAPLAAGALLAIFAAGVLSVDAGNLWQNRRNLVTSTDAAVLTEAARLALDPSSAACSTGWQNLLTRNAGADWYTEAGEGCIVHAFGNTGYVTVDARQPSASFFSGVVGIGDGSVYSMSGAMWGYVGAGQGLRPMGICWENHHIQEWLAKVAGTMSNDDYLALRGSDVDHPTLAGSTGVLHKIMFNKDNPDQCGSEAPGNWGWMDFNGGSNSNADTQKWVRNGYPGSVAVGDCYADGADLPCEGDTGSGGGSVDQELKYLKDNQILFHVPIFGEVTGGGGSTADFEMKGFLGVQLWDYQITGSESSRYFTFEFRNLLIQGPCCVSDSDGPETGGNKGVRLCTVDHDPQAASDRCTAT